ncbi:MAG TPA: dihydropteroate synthase [Alphaproteobacteria bacterium]|nr:dihydropteroate synthase [Alphaproteobacteria bacterium]
MVEAGHALWLAGGPYAFTSAELRTRDGAIAMLNVDELSSRADLRDTLDRLTAPRAPFAGLDLATPRIMGIVNVTPDSFSDGGDFAAPGAAIDHGKALIKAGADILDIGGESTRPGAAPVMPAEEIDRVLPVIAGLSTVGVPLSIDTRNAATMRAAIAAGAAIINDVSALTHDPESLKTAAVLGVPIILMHMRGEPATMREDARYDDVVREVFDELSIRVDAAVAAGITRGRIAVDPGFGFAKASRHNVAVLQDLTAFHGLGCALTVGVSRKSFLAAITRESDPKARLGASLAAALAALARGARIVRVHDVAETAQAIATWQTINGGRSELTNDVSA